MARASSTTVCYEVRSRATGAEFIVAERSWYSARIANGRVVRTPLQTELKDPSGRLFERVSSRVLRCVASNEDVDVLGVAPSIRPTTPAR
jgi:hypothetical protein